MPSCSVSSFACLRFLCRWWPLRALATGSARRGCVVVVASCGCRKACRAGLLSCSGSWDCLLSKGRGPEACGVAHRACKAPECCRQTASAAVCRSFCHSPPLMPDIPARLPCPVNAVEPPRKAVGAELATRPVTTCKPVVTGRRSGGPCVVGSTPAADREGRPPVPAHWPAAARQASRGWHPRTPPGQA